MTTAGNVGFRRQISAMAKKRKGFLPNATEDDCYGGHIRGAQAEYLVSLVFNLHWNDAVGSVSGCDVGGILEVRCRPLDGVGLDLGLQPKDNQEKPLAPFVLVHSLENRFWLIGWIYGREGWEVGTLNAKTGLHFVKGSVPPLHPIADLYPIVERLRFSKSA